MGAAAELHRHTRHIHDTHHIGVLLAEHRHRTSGLGGINGHLLHRQGVGLSNPAVDQPIDLLQFISADRPRAVEVKPQTIKVHQ